MLDIGWTELLVVGLVLILVVGPKDLPRVLRTIGQWTSRARRVARDFQDSLDDIARDSEIDEMRKQFDDSTGIKDSLESTVDPEGTLREAINTDFAEEETLASKETPAPGYAEDPASSSAVQSKTPAAPDGEVKKKIEKENRKGAEDKISLPTNKIIRNEEKSAKS